ncbi:MAG: 23S rRNA (adenine(2503)-C(2))-methyltransferase RlmN [Clostridia bacterium]|nr:23S rRNA (adenine(2503)-C(2))-methyltransferase RlmN [Clostridia bacterium]
MSIDLLSLNANEIAALVADMGLPAFRAKQLRSWVAKGVPVEEMSNLPRDFRQKLIDQGCHVTLPRIVKKLVSAIDGTVKYLFALRDGELIESVVMKYKHGNTICISSQAGCRMGCRFCASTLRGLTRNLEASEILGQVMKAQADMGERISNIVMMGIGEPLDNYDNVIKFLRLVNAEDGLNIGYRHISLSTCGVVDGIRKLMKEELPITLSISLHNIDTEERKALMPITNKWSVEELLSACRDYFAETGRRISFEYTLIAGENDSATKAEALAKGLKKQLGSMPIHVNLIPLNDVSERNYRKSGAEAVTAFQKTLNERGINATVRRKLGPDINASCGQLRYNGREQ